MGIALPPKDVPQGRARPPGCLGTAAQRVLVLLAGPGIPKGRWPPNATSPPLSEWDFFVCLSCNYPIFPPSLGVGCAGDKVITLPPESGLRGPADLSEHLSASTPMWGVSLWSRERWGGGGHEGQTLGLRALEEAVERGVAAAVGPPDTPTHPFPYDCLPLALQPRGLWVLGSLGADGGQGPFPHLGDTSPGPRQPPMSWWFLQTHPWPQPTCRTGRSGAVPEPAPSAVERRNQSTYLSTRVGRVNV